MTTQYTVKGNGLEYTTTNPEVAEQLSYCGYLVSARTGEFPERDTAVPEWSDTSVKTVEAIADSQAWDQVKHDMRDEQQRRL